MPIEDETTVTSNMPLAEVLIEDKTTVIPNITSMTLDSFGTLSNTEDRAADLLVLGDLSGLFDLRGMTLGSAVSHWQRQQLEQLTLDQYTFLADMTIAEVADMSGLYSKSVDDIPIVETAIATFLKNPVLASERNLTLSQFLDRYPEIGSIKLGLLQLAEYHYSTIPKLLATPITAIPGWQELAVSNIVGLSELPIHQDIQLDGEIVSLSTVRKNDQTEIQLTQGPGASTIWYDDEQHGLQPFNSFFLQPTIAGEKIMVSAYFKSCSLSPDNCQFIGPFDYPDYKVGDSFYVSAEDWDAMLVQDDSVMKFKREIAPAVPDTATDPFYQALLLKIAGVGALVIFGLGLPSFYWLTRRRAKL